MDPKQKFGPHHVYAFKVSPSHAENITDSVVISAEYASKSHDINFLEHVRSWAASATVQMQSKAWADMGGTLEIEVSKIVPLADSDAPTLQGPLGSPKFDESEFKLPTEDSAITLLPITCGATKFIHELSTKKKSVRQFNFPFEALCLELDKIAENEVSASIMKKLQIKRSAAQRIKVMDDEDLLEGMFDVEASFDEDKGVQVAVDMCSAQCWERIKLSLTRPDAGLARLFRCFAKRKMSVTERARTKLVKANLELEQMETRLKATLDPNCRDKVEAGKAMEPMRKDQRGSIPEPEEVAAAKARVQAAQELLRRQETRDVENDEELFMWNLRIQETEVLIGNVKLCALDECQKPGSPKVLAAAKRCLRASPNPLWTAYDLAAALDDQAQFPPNENTSDDVRKNNRFWAGVFTRIATSLAEALNLPKNRDKDVAAWLQPKLNFEPKIITDALDDEEEPDFGNDGSSVQNFATSKLFVSNIDHLFENANKRKHLERAKQDLVKKKLSELESEAEKMTDANTVMKIKDKEDITTNQLKEMLADEIIKNRGSEKNINDYNSLDSAKNKKYMEEDEQRVKNALFITFKYFGCEVIDCKIVPAEEAAKHAPKKTMGKAAEKVAKPTIWALLTMSSTRDVYKALRCDIKALDAEKVKDKGETLDSVPIVGVGIKQDDELSPSLHVEEYNEAKHGSPVRTAKQMATKSIKALQMISPLSLWSRLSPSSIGKLEDAGCTDAGPLYQSICQGDINFASVGWVTDYIQSVESGALSLEETYDAELPTGLAIGFVSGGKLEKVRVEFYRRLVKFKVWPRQLFSALFYLWCGVQVPRATFKSPMARMIFDTTAYIFFLCVFTFGVALDHWDVMHLQMSELDGTAFWVRAYSWVYLVGSLEKESRQLVRLGLPTYLSEFWNWVELLSPTTGILGLALIESASFDSESTAYDPIKPARDALAVALVFVWCRLLQLFRASKSIGPLIPVILRMLAEVAKFGSVMLVMIVGFSLAMHSILRPEANFSVLNETTDFGWRSEYETLAATAWTLSYASIGAFNYDFSGAAHQAVAQILFGLYVVMMLLALLNLLITLLMKRYDEVSEEMAKQFSFVRASSVFWQQDSVVSGAPPSLLLCPPPRILPRNSHCAEMLQLDNELPPPFNLIHFSPRSRQVGVVDMAGGVVSSSVHRFYRMLVSGDLHLCPALFFGASRESRRRWC
eukprot:COSAG05_NODE_1418_length_4940_cov_2.779384_1_plen_1202_part_00